MACSPHGNEPVAGRREGCRSGGQLLERIHVEVFSRHQQNMDPHLGAGWLADFRYQRGGREALGREGGGTRAIRGDGQLCKGST